uniref:Haloacid dehalogenase like hydrolase domain containing 3 n=1 Tax=Equus caballus TaxID=9796 RepID=F6RSI4_HORSE
AEQRGAGRRGAVGGGAKRRGRGGAAGGGARRRGRRGAAGGGAEWAGAQTVEGCDLERSPPWSAWPLGSHERGAGLRLWGAARRLRVSPSLRAAEASHVTGFPARQVSAGSLGLSGIDSGERSCIQPLDNRLGHLLCTGIFCCEDITQVPANRTHQAWKEKTFSVWRGGLVQLGVPSRGAELGWTWPPPADHGALATDPTADVGCEGHTGVRDAQAVVPIAEQLYEDFSSPGTWQVLEGAEATLRGCRKRGLRLAVVSNFDRRLEDILVGLGLREHFDFVLTSEAVGWPKPDSRIFHEALRLAQVEPAVAAHVGDSYHCDYKGARAIGMHSFLVAGPGHLEPAVKDSVPQEHILPSLSHLLPALVRLEGSPWGL